MGDFGPGDRLGDVVLLHGDFPDIERGLAGLVGLGDVAPDTVD